MATKTILPMKRYQDLDTGEVYYAEQIATEYYGVRPFWKLYREDFLPVMKDFDGKQKEILIYIIEKMKQYDNSFEGTFKSISKAVNVSEATVARTMKKLQEDKFIALKTPGVWRVNPNCLMKGNEQKRIILEKQFCELLDRCAIMEQSNEPKEDLT